MKALLASIGHVRSLISAMLAVMFRLGFEGNVSRKMYIDNAETVSYTPSGTSALRVSMGNANTLIFDLQGTVVGAAGAIVGRGIKEAIASMVIRSSSMGEVAVGMDGDALFQQGRRFGAIPRLDETEAGGGTAGFTVALPLGQVSGDLITISITWSALATFHSTATSYSGVLTVVPELLPGAAGGDGFAFYYRQVNVGVIGASAVGFVVPGGIPILPTPAFLFGFMFLTYSGTLDQTPDERLTRYRLSHDGNRYLDISSRSLQDIFTREFRIAAVAGVNFGYFQPFQNTQATSFLVDNDATATIAGTNVLFFYYARAPGPIGAPVAGGGKR